MFVNDIRTAGRSLWKQRFYTFLNIFGLSLGLAGSLLLFQFIRYHLGFDAYHRKAGQTFRLVTELHLPGQPIIYDQGTPLGLTSALRQAVPQIADQAVLMKEPAVTVEVAAYPEQPVPGSPGRPVPAADTEAVSRYPGLPQTSTQRRLFSLRDECAFADEHWFNLFDYTWLKGDPHNSLQAPNTAVLTASLAEKFFGKEDGLGKTLLLNGKYLVTITGILKDIPSNTSLKTSLFLSRPTFHTFYPLRENEMINSWGYISSSTQSYIYLPDPGAIHKAEEAIGQLKKQHFDPSTQSAYQFPLQPLQDLHFNTHLGGVIQKPLLGTLGLVALAMLLIACFNFVNIATAQGARRAKEVGTRKVLGSTAAGIFRQFIIETACIVLLAALSSLLWIALSLRLIRNWLQTDLPFSLLKDPVLLSCFAGIMILLTVAAGFYPALVLSRWKPIDALRNQPTAARSVLFRKGLVITQQVLVQVLIIGTLVISLQVRYLKNANPGFNKEAVLMIPIPDTDKNKQTMLADLLRANPTIRSLSFCRQAPLSDTRLGGSVLYDQRAWEDFSARSLIGDNNYLNTFHLQLLAGSDLHPSDTVREFLVNETLVRQLRIKDPQQAIGHRLIAGGLDDHPGIIAGVVKDFHINPLSEALEPTLITTVQNKYQYVAVKLDGTDPGKTRESIQRSWQSVYPDNVFEYHYLDEAIDGYYHKEDLLNKLIHTSALLAILISCIGLFGLVTFFSFQRKKELGIRKLLGATVPGLLFLQTRDFLKIATLSTLIAIPLAWYGTNNWLQTFAYRITIHWWIFLAAGLLSCTLALFTIAYQVLKAACANPVKSLRPESGI